MYKETAAGSTMKTPDELARTALLDRDYEAVLAATEAAIAGDPGNFQLHYLRGRAFAARKDYDSAIACYERAVQCDLAQPLAHISLGIVSRQQGRPDVAVGHYRLALALDPQSFEANLNLGNASLDLSDFSTAAAAFTSAVAANAQSAGAWLGLARASFALEQNAEAGRAYGRALALQPDSVECLAALATLSRAAGHHAEAARYLGRILALHPDAAEPYVDRGLDLYHAGEVLASVDAFERALALQPGNLAALVNLGVSLTELQRYDEAVAVLRRALETDARSIEAHVNLAVSCYRARHIDQSLQHCARVFELEPRHSGTLTAKGVILMERRRLPEAIDCFRHAISSDPANAKAHTNLGLALLMTGEMREGWTEYEWRWKTLPRLADPALRFSQPQWRGEELAGRRLLIHAEQGFGDTLQFVRFAPLAAARGAVVFVETQKPLEGLVRALPGIERAFAFGDNLPEFDLHCPMLSLPKAFDTSLETIPQGIPYVSAEVGKVREWGMRLADQQGMKVGLVWAGGARKHDINCDLVDQRRSMDLADLSPLAQVDGVIFVSLQVGTPAGQKGLDAFAGRLLDFTADIRDFTDTAALVNNLDLVIAVDTSVAHLAGAMGKPVWMLSRFDGCWRWLLDRDASPWYPTMRIFRQPEPGDWATLVTGVRAALAHAAARYASRRDDA